MDQPAKIHLMQKVFCQLILVSRGQLYKSLVNFNYS